ncbi:MAG: hypothetical protein HQL22_03215 [Candidatus Omnitrophica bacterium]|nr:hypothetical protein [Candidatus Omnitrophota bacterium]
MMPWILVFLAFPLNKPAVVTQGFATHEICEQVRQDLEKAVRAQVNAGIGYSKCIDNRIESETRK